MEPYIVDSLVEKIVEHAYHCDGHIIPQSDTFFRDLLISHHGNPDLANDVVRRATELGLCSYDRNRFALLPEGVSLYKDYRNDLSRYINSSARRRRFISLTPAVPFWHFVVVSILTLASFAMSLYSVLTR